MKEHPILFSTPMVQAILAGNKTQTRRIVKNQCEHTILDNYGLCRHCDHGTGYYLCRYGKVGDILWVRETWNTLTAYEEKPDYSVMSPRDFVYKADDNRIDKWKPSIFMPKEACRIRLEITDIRVERLCDIRTLDALAEGIELVSMLGMRYINYTDRESVGLREPILSYLSLWESIHGRDSIGKNPWVWVIEFKLTNKPQ